MRYENGNPDNPAASYGTDMTENRRRRSSASAKKKAPGKTDIFMKLLIMQSVLCAAAVLTALLISKFSPGTFAKMKADYGRMTEKNMSIGEIFSEIKNGTRQVLAVYSGGDEEVTGVPETEQYEAVIDETGETVAVGEIIEGSGGGDIGEKEAAKGTSFADYKISEKPAMPVKDLRITSKFGYRVNPVSGEYGFHTGLDLAVSEGSPVSAAYYGTVEETGESDVWGRYILLKHSDGLETYYCHLSEIYVSDGAVIRKGETVGLVGSTGWSTGPHLHFEVRIGGVRVDPEKLLFADVREA